MRKLETMVHLNANMLKEVIRNQEMMYTGQCKLVDMTAKTPDEGQNQKTYADAIEGVGVEVAEQVSKKIEKMPSVTIPVQRSREEIAGIIDEIQDKEKRKLNVVVHNLKESKGKTQSERAKDDEENFVVMVKEALKIIVKTERNFRVGKKDDSKPRLLVVTLRNMTDKLEILRLAASLRD